MRRGVGVPTRAMTCPATWWASASAGRGSSRRTDPSAATPTAAGATGPAAPVGRARGAGGADGRSRGGGVSLVVAPEEGGGDRPVADVDPEPVPPVVPRPPWITA